MIDLARLIKAVAIVAETKTGATARAIAGGRPKVPVVVITPESRVAQQLALLHGTKVYVRPDDKFAATKMTDWLRTESILKKGDTIVVASGGHPGAAGGTDTIKVRVLK